MVLILSVVLVAPVFAADAKTVQVKGYLWEGMTVEDIAAARTQLEISNVTDSLDLKKDVKIIGMSGTEPLITSNGNQMDGVFVANSPVTIKNIDDGSVFEVYKLKKDGSNYTYDLNGALPFTSGKVQIYAESVKTVDVSEMHNYSFGEQNYLPGCTITIEEPGDYYAIFRYPAEADAAEVFITVNGKADSTPAPAPALKAVPTASKVLVNGTVISFDAYNINGNNYFKLRDIAKAFNIGVTWDGATNTIGIDTSIDYIEP